MEKTGPERPVAFAKPCQPRACYLFICKAEYFYFIFFFSWATAKRLFPRQRYACTHSKSDGSSNSKQKDNLPVSALWLIKGTDLFFSLSRTFEMLSEDWKEGEGRTKNTGSLSIVMVTWFCIRHSLSPVLNPHCAKKRAFWNSETHNLNAL